uniref:tRNA-intron lyase n=1 Tax=Aplanochytrium stocchinoi TaxID=215587 RepID=A0A7S3LN17_9STRA
MRIYLDNDNSIYFMFVQGRSKSLFFSPLPLTLEEALCAHIDDSIDVRVFPTDNTSVWLAKSVSQSQKLETAHNGKASQFVDILLGRPELERRLHVFLDFWKNGWFIGSGSNFGVHFLVYESHPSSCHSRYMVYVCDPIAEEAENHPCEWQSLASLARKVNKVALLAFVSENHNSQGRKISYLSLESCLLKPQKSWN